MDNNENIDILYHRIRERRIELEMSQEELADKMGYKSKSSINKIELGINDIPQSKIIEFAKALKTTPAYLMGWDSDVEPLPSTPTVDIPVYGTIPAGVPLEAIEDTIGHEDIPTDWLRGGKEYIGHEDIPTDWLRGGKEYIGLKIKGDSMYPKYFEDDIVIIKLQPCCENRQDVAVYVNGYDVTLKNCHKNDDGSVTLVPFNREYPPKTYRKGDDFKIIGVVMELRRKF